MKDFKVKKQKNSLILRVNPLIYSPETVYLTCYTFIDKAYLYLNGDPKKEIIVRLKGKKKLLAKQLNSLAGEFYNELLHNALRQKIAKQNKRIREAIVLQSLFASQGVKFQNLSKPAKPKKSKSMSTLNEDPLGIAVLWEKKYGKSKNKNLTKRARRKR